MTWVTAEGKNWASHGVRATVLSRYLDRCGSCSEILHAVMPAGATLDQSRERAIEQVRSYELREHIQETRTLSNIECPK